MVAMAELLIFSQKAGADCKKWSAIKGGSNVDFGCHSGCLKGIANPGSRLICGKRSNIIMETAREYGIPLPSRRSMLNCIMRCFSWETDSKIIRDTCYRTISRRSFNESNIKTGSMNKRKSIGLLFVLLLICQLFPILKFLFDSSSEIYQSETPYNMVFIDAAIRQSPTARF